MKDLFGTKQSFARERGKSRVSYNPRSAFMKAHSLNATQVKEPWGAVKRGPDVPIWKTESSRLTTEGNIVYVRNGNSYFYVVELNLVSIIQRSNVF